MSDPDQKMAFSVEEAAERSDLCRDTIYRAIADGALVARKSGRRTLILRSDLEGYLVSLPRMGRQQAAQSEKADRR